ncbi:hypothetical protein PISL3812_06340 [Talaromyces islandicus]|uniref:Uncharacterized protein n=1 Tax=Talaromyces islandicus TaxID=28573 RepID=A0A0U1M1D2_TALIS|nr:hypothetical protein PISL3812_06340 [Talaromyces islandicus]
MMISKEQDDPDENTVLVDSFRASFERWSRPAHKQAAQPNEQDKPVTENTRLANSYRTAFVGWVPPNVPGSTVNVQDTTTHSITSKEVLNGDVALPPLSPVTAPSRRRPQQSPSPITTEKEEMMKAEVASPQLKAELEAIKESVRNGKWWVERAKERRALRFGTSNPEAMKPGANDKNYVVEPNAASKTNYMDKFPKGMSVKQRHEMQYKVYQDSVRAHFKYKRGKSILASTTKTDVPAYETVSSTPSLEEMYKTLVLKRSRRNPDNKAEANWSLYSAASKEKRFELTKRLWLWLDDTILEAWIVDIHHEPFFTGMAHADGMRGFYIAPDLWNDAAPTQKGKLKVYCGIERETLRLASPGNDY